ncbi:MAG: hypothetical protein AAF430_07330 [Myxococcota bacterium]
MPFVPFDAFWLCLACLLVSSAGCLRRLRRHHPQVWDALGQPGFLPFGNWSGSRSLTAFYWSGQPARLPDPTLHRWVLAQRTGQLCLAMVLVALVQLRFVG